MTKDPTTGKALWRIVPDAVSTLSCCYRSLFLPQEVDAVLKEADIAKLKGEEEK
jgi:hypothetical protein